MQRWAELSGFRVQRFGRPFWGAFNFQKGKVWRQKRLGWVETTNRLSGLWRPPLFQWARETLRLLVCTKTPIAMAERAVGLLQAGIVIFFYGLPYKRFHIHLFKTNRSSTISFVFPAFPAPLQPLFVILGRSWLVGLSGPLILQMVATSEWPSVMHSFYLIVFGKPVGHREVAPVHSRVHLTSRSLANGWESLIIHVHSPKYGLKWFMTDSDPSPRCSRLAKRMSFWVASGGVGSSGAQIRLPALA